MKNKLKVLSLFDGISCGQVALTQLGFEVDYSASEIDKNAIEVTMYNFPETKHLGDVTQLSVKNGQFDLLIGGSPCQSFSIAGNREGFEGESGLFYEYVRILKEAKPKYFLLENVKMKEEWQDIITKALQDIYPETYVININSKLVSAQLRNRFYWTNIPNVQQPEDRKILLQSILESGFTDREKARAILESESRPLRNKEKMYRRYKQAGFTTIVYENSIEDKENIRYFTQTELERLQTLPEGYTKIHKRDIAAGLIGDGWTVEVIKHILKNLWTK